MKGLALVTFISVMTIRPDGHPISQEFLDESLSLENVSWELDKALLHSDLSRTDEISFSPEDAQERSCLFLADLLSAFR